MSTAVQPTWRPTPSCGCGAELTASLAALVPAVFDSVADVASPTRRATHRRDRDPGRHRPPGRSGVLGGRGHRGAWETASSRWAQRPTCWPPRGTTRPSIDRDGAVVLPGFIEPHAHLLPSALMDGFLDVGPFAV